jgi:hypothetical protein
MRTIVKGLVLSLGLWLVLALVVSSIGHSFFVPDEIKDLADRGRPTQGKVVRKEAQDHQRVDYAYSVDGNEYSGSGQAGAGNARFADLEPGTTVWVYYNPVNPSISWLGSPEYELESLELLIRAAAIAIPFWPVLIFFVLYFALSRSRSSKMSDDMRLTLP